VVLDQYPGGGFASAVLEVKRPLRGRFRSKTVQVTGHKLQIYTSNGYMYVTAIPQRTQVSVRPWPLAKANGFILKTGY
jgi:hypothetical protein